MEEEASSIAGITELLILALHLHGIGFSFLIRKIKNLPTITSAVNSWERRQNNRINYFRIFLPAPKIIGNPSCRRLSCSWGKVTPKWTIDYSASCRRFLLPTLLSCSGIQPTHPSASLFSQWTSRPHPANIPHNSSENMLSTRRWKYFKITWFCGFLKEHKIMLAE